MTAPPLLLASESVRQRHREGELMGFDIEGIRSANPDSDLQFAIVSHPCSTSVAKQFAEGAFERLTLESVDSFPSRRF
ncbi:hypothetical protein NMY22_g15886 [Coprinellus aureogranulatus]|nr:hypothetical protein NMY22_g15886 [Coprinellus aureogranulatus]